ncbi:MAG: DUF4157 domain-containing protein, partial [Desulfobacterales bacterium]|nr:DUF4157 domain-containing protein [Desulfobacterales bacterium]
MKRVAEKKYSQSSAKTASPKAPESKPAPQGIEMMRQLLGRGTIAAQLKIGSPSDPSEMEADRVADAVVNDTGTTIPLQENRSAIAPKRTAGPQTPATPPGSLVNSSNPRRLNTTEQDYFEQRFNQNFSNIRIHEGSAASHAASAINARAFTHGSDIYLKHGEYSFNTTGGKRLMAHELAHTLQPDNGFIRRWNGSEHRAFGNIAGGMAAKKSGAYMQALFDLTGSKDSEMKTGVLEASALRMSSERKKIDKDEVKIRKGHDLKTTQSMYIPYKDVYPLAEYEKEMLLGTASELSGDHRKSKEDLAASPDGDAKLTDYALGGFDPRYLVLAWTNFNHFFPLAAKEWEKNHEKAKKSAREANDAFRLAATGSKKRGHYISKGNGLLKDAMQYEAFGLHFLQDAFASGHQYPRAFDLTQPTEFTLSKEVADGDGTKTQWQTVYSFKEVSRLKAQGWTLMGAGDKSTGHKCRVYHDLLCALEQGIPLRYPKEGDHKAFHGDGTADSTDYPVAEETYNSMAEVLCTAFSANMETVDAKKPTLPKGPNIPKIMEDEIAAPIWYAMEYDLARNFKANIGNKDTTAREHTTDSR